MGDDRKRNYADLEALNMEWVSRFPHEKIPYSLLQKVLEMCKVENCDPRWIVRSVNLKATNPTGYLATMLRIKPFPLPEDGPTRAAYRWENWANRNTAPIRQNSLGDILRAAFGQIDAHTGKQGAS